MDTRSEARRRIRRPTASSTAPTIKDPPAPGFIPNPEGPTPPLPWPIPFPPEPELPPIRWPLPEGWPPYIPHPLQRSLRHGCYLIRYTPAQVSLFPTALHYDGTLRVERTGNNTTASGDLYIHQVRSWPVIGLTPPGSPGRVSIRPRLLEPNPAAGIPIFSRGRYRYYLRVTQILESRTFRNSFTLGFDLYRFTSTASPLSSAWANEGSFTAEMRWTPAPAGYPSSGDYLTGDVEDRSGSSIGLLTMGWVSPYLRRAVLEIDRVSVSEAALNNAAGIDWRDIFDGVGWNLTVIESDANLAQPSGDSWSDAEMHAAMLTHRDSTDLDSEWRYYLICVRRLDSTSRGIMYDNGATDSNNVPREGAGISSHWTIPNSDPWGRVKGLRFGAAPAPYFRTAVHEIGHAMGLYHNTIDMGIMNTTDVIAASAVTPTQFPDNIEWSHAPDDQKRLRHMPDIWVRPGGIAFGSSYSTAPISPNDMIEDIQGLQLRVLPLHNTLPLGAPVRINYSLVNASDQPLPAPASLSLKAGFVKGKVVDPHGVVRAFSPLVLCVEDQVLNVLGPSESVGNSATLLRGPQGSLFPSSGPHRVIIEIVWEIDGIAMGVTGEAEVMITSPQTESHAAAALKILSTPDVLLTLALGGDHLPDGIAAIQAGLADETLRPHYAVVEAKRLGRRFGGRGPDVAAAADLMREDVEITPAEMRRVAEFVTQVRGAAKASKDKITKVLRVKAADIGATDVLDMLKGS